MTQQHVGKAREKMPRLRGVGLAATLALTAAGSAHAFEIKTENPDIEVRWDNTVRYNLAQRVQSQDGSILNSPNFDDGDRNFNKGVVSNRGDLLTEFDLIYRKRTGFRVSGAGWYDAAYRKLDNRNVASSNHLENGAPALGLSNATKRWHKGLSGEVLDAFVFTRLDLGEMPLDLKLGRHTVYWGESVLNPVHGVSYGQSPLDLRKAQSVPGTEAKELFVPREALSAQLQATPDLSLAAQYFFKWDPFRVPEAGAFLSGQDPLLEGGESQILTHPATGATVGRLVRGNDVEPQNRGDFGLAARWNPEWLDGTLGFYGRRTSDIAPQAHFRLTSATTGTYHFVYADKIDIFGVSLSKSLGGMSFGGELNYRRDMPLISDAVRVNPAATPAQIAAGQILALPSAGETGGARGDTWHGVVNLIGNTGRTPLFDASNWTVELAWNRWDRVTQGANVFKGRSGYTKIDRVTKDFVGLAANFTPIWYQAFPGVDLYLPISYSVGLSGTSAVTGGGNKDAGTFSVGLGADMYQKYRFDLKYARFFGSLETNAAGQITANAGANALLKDRGFVALTFKTTF